MLNYKRLAPRSADPKVYTHNNEKITHQEADMINNGTFIEGETSVPGEYITAQEVVQKLAAQHKHVNYMIGGDELNELVCYYTWSSDTIDPTGVHIPDLEMTVEDRKLLAYEITPENADVTSAVFSIVSGSDIAHIDGSYVVADKQGTAIYKVVVNGSIEDTATINVSNKPEEFPDDAQHRWIRVQPESSQISVDGGTINVTGSYGLTGSYGTEKKVGDITDTIVIESNSSQDPKSGSKIYYYNNNQFDTPTAKITWTQPGRSEEFPEEWTYVFEYNISDTNGGSSTDTSLGRQYYANGQEIKHADDFILDGITSYRTKTGTFGTVKKENVQYSGEIGRPSGYNYSDQEITESGKLIQDGSNKELQWSYTQEANVKVWGISADPTSLHFEAAGGTQSVSITTWYTWQTNDNNNQKFDETTTEEQITAEANTSTQQKEWTETITKNGESVSINCTQDGKRESFTVKYHLYVGSNADNINDNTVSLVWQSDQYGESSKKTAYVKAYKELINESNEVVSTEAVEYSITSYSSQSKFSVNKRGTLVDFYPLEENTDYSESKDCAFRVSITGQKNKFCTISLIQEKKGVKIISGDAVMFTYNWDQGRDLDQATFVNLNHPSSNNNNYAGFKGEIIPEYGKILYFAGDNIGTGNEYAFIDFKSISEYLKEHGDEASSIDGKTIIESLTNDNGLIQIECDLYTNWYGTKKQEGINLAYSVYNKDSEDASVSYGDKQFILKGYTKILDSSDQALCYANGYANGFAINRNVKKGYTLSAKFIYYFNSGVFSFKTNKDNVGIWNKGCVLTDVFKDISCSDVRFTNDGENVNLSLSLDSINASDYFDKETPFNIDFDMRTTADKYFYNLGWINLAINELPYKVNINKPLTEFKFANFEENQSVEVYPLIHIIDCIVNYDHGEALKLNDVEFKNNTVTIQKPST